MPPIKERERTQKTQKEAPKGGSHEVPPITIISAATEKPAEPYTLEEHTVLGHIKDIISGDFFHHLPTEAINDSNTQTPRAIVAEARALIVTIRTQKRNPQEFFEYQDKHFDDPKYAFLGDEYPGLNVNGWRVLLAELDPMKYGVAIMRKEFQIRGTISQRSAKM